MIIQKDLQGKIIGRYSTVAEASEKTDIISRNIYSVLAGDRKTAGGSMWERSEEKDIPDDGEENSFEWEEADGGARFSGVIRGKQISSLEELLQYCKADLNVWEVKSHKIKTWVTTMKVKSYIDRATALPPVPGKGFVGKELPVHEPIQVLNTGFTVEFILRTGFKEKLKETLLTHVTAYPQRRVNWDQRKRRYVVEFMITDHHLGKTGFDPHTLKLAWPIEEAIKQYENIVDFGLTKIDYDQVEEIWLIAGNDLIHVDNQQGTTTSGTKVAEDVFWLTLFQYAKEAVATAALRLSQYARVKVIFIPGNHDETGALALSEVIKEMFRHDNTIQVVCGGTGREYQNFGCNLIGWHHGKGNDPRRGANMMIADVPDLFSKAKYRALHVGHTHTSSRTEVVSLNTLKEDHGIIYEICPTVTPTDAWHHHQLWVGSLRRSKIYQYEYDAGLEGVFIYNP